MAKVERCVDCLVKEVIEMQLHPMNFNRDGRFMLSRTRQHFAATGLESIQSELRSDTAIFYPLLTAKNNSYYHKHFNYQDCLHSATV